MSCAKLTLVYVVLWQLTHLTVNHTCITPEESLFTGRKLKLKKDKMNTGEKEYTEV